MAGGIGSRFWPHSRNAMPKQFLDILGIGKSLLQMTYGRALSLAPRENIYIITSREYADITATQLPHLPKANILKEPLRKNTAPCIAYFSHKIFHKDPQAITFIAPSDHLIIKEKEFYEIMDKSISYAAQHEALLTMGILPTRPDTGYGYIQVHDDITKSGVKKVKTFTEKPDIRLAKEFVRSGEFLWNSGMFVWSVHAIMHAFDTYQQEMHQLFYSLKNHYNTSHEEKHLNNIYVRCNNISIDYAIMEKAKNVFAIPANIGWSDLGTWGSLYEHRDKDYWGNTVNNNNMMMYEAENNIVVCENADKLVVVQGLNDYIVVDTEDVLMICNKEKEQQIKDILSDLKRQSKEKYL